MVIKYTDKSLIKLSENISHYSNKLNNPKVYINFMTLITNNSKMAKSAIKEILMELSTKIEKIVENEGFDVLKFNKTPGKCNYKFEIYIQILINSTLYYRFKKSSQKYHKKM